MPVPLTEDKSRIKAALLLERGNITRAAKRLGVSKTHGMNLMKLFSLGAWALRIRKKHGLPSTGRPPTKFRA